MLNKIVILLVAIAAVVLRFWHLGEHSIWADEQDSLMQSRVLDEIWPKRGNGALYFFILHYWRKITGDSAFALRSLSAILSCLSLFLSGWMTYRLTKDKRSTALCIWLAGCFPLLAWHARDARMYPLWGLACMVALLLLLLLREKGYRTSLYLGYWLAQTGALFSHSFHALYLVVFLPVSYVVCCPKITRKEWLLLSTPTVLLLAVLAFRVMALSEQPYAYLLQHAYRPWDFRLIASIAEIFLYENPANAHFSQSGAGLAIILVLLALSAALYWNPFIERRVGIALLLLFWGPFVLTHLLPVRDHARLFVPVAQIFPLMTSLALFRKDLPAWQLGNLGFASGMIALALWVSPLRLALGNDMESWKRACHFLRKMPRDVLVVSELNQPESPITQCKLKQKVYVHNAHSGNTERLFELLSKKERFVIFRSPPWVNKQDSLLFRLDEVRHLHDTRRYGPYLYRTFVQKRK